MTYFRGKLDCYTTGAEGNPCQLSEILSHCARCPLLKFMGFIWD